MYVIGVDIGGTSTRVALFEAQGLQLRIVQQTDCPTDPAHVVGPIADAIRALVPADTDVAACGVGVPEYVHQGEVLSSMVVRLAPADIRALERTVAAASHRPAVVHVDADVRCAALAEWHALGDAKASMAYVSLGTGLSCALVGPGGECWEGASGGAISLGEWPAAATGIGMTPATTNLERFASGRGVEERFHEATGLTATCREVCAKSADGDPLATEVLTEAGVAIGGAVRQLYAVLDPTYVVVGGGLGSASTPVWDSLLSAATAPIAGREPVKLRQAALGPQSGILGAALTALRTSTA
jgi:glucokinase